MAIRERTRETEGKTKRKSGRPVNAMVAAGNELDTRSDRHERTDEDPRRVADEGPHSGRAIRMATHHENTGVEKRLQFVYWRCGLSEVIADPRRHPAQKPLHCCRRGTRSSAMAGRRYNSGPTG